MEIKNIYLQKNKNSKSEIIEDIIFTKSFRLEKISSFGYPTPNNKWYNQDKNEWVLLLKGQATLKFKKDVSRINLKEGDYIFLEKHLEHRVEYVSKDAIWLCIHYK